MDRLVVILLSCCYACFVEGNTAPSREEPPYGKWKNWKEAFEALRNKYKMYKDTKPVGKDVEVRAEVMYDTAFYNGSMKWKIEDNSDVGKKDTVMKKYFEELLAKLQLYFHNQSIFVNITVASATEMNKLTVFYANGLKIVNANKTLEKIQEYGRSQKKGHNTIFYLFTWPENKGNPKRLFDFITTTGKPKLGVPVAATKGTFCSGTTSAALVRHTYGSGKVWSAASATTTVFGSDNFFAIPSNDRDEMNTAFSRCGVHTQETLEVPQC
uniref:Putative 28 kDa metastriate family member n=1 Tax=Rhipicephalus pulchellus TaxID=72859 RepID=L7MBM4_RHIPC